MPRPSLNHIAIIMDGNKRWARARKKGGVFGHREGVKRVREVIKETGRREVPYLTLFAFSAENWQRSTTEVRQLMTLFVTTLKRELNELVQQRVTLRFIGQCESFPEQLQAEMKHAETTAAVAEPRLQVAVATNYGGRQDIIAGVQRIAAKVQAGELSAEAVGEKVVAGAMALSDWPEPDLLIRTGGELRVSNFLLWQIAYTELYFTKTLWPDFDGAAFAAALEDFSRRERRFGRRRR